jgi:hypothetical protein
MFYCTVKGTKMKKRRMTSVYVEKPYSTSHHSFTALGIKRKTKVNYVVAKEIANQMNF